MTRNSVLKPNQEMQTELHASSQLIIPLLVISAFITIFSTPFVPDSDERLKMRLFALLFYALAGGIWILKKWWDSLGRWSAVIALIAVMGLGSTWLGIPGFLLFVGVPIIWAAAVLNLSAATLAAAGETALVLLLSRYGLGDGNPVMILMAVAAVWLTLGLMIVIYVPMLQITRWFAEDYQYAHQALEEARDRKEELEQALKDLAQANRELTLLTEKLAAARRSAEQAHEAKATFVAKISHEFRTPLNMIIGLIDTLTETPEVYGPEIPPGLLKDLEIVYRNSTHLAGMINDVLDLSQTEASSFTLHREQADLAADVESALVVVKPLLEKKKLTLQTLIPTNLPPVYYDRTRIRQVILNLISNAARYTDQGGLTVEVKPQPQHVVVSIADTGPGIAPEDITRIFAPFYQSLDLSQRHPGGSGLGLSVSKQLIELHGGKIWVESEVGAGSTFYFELPLAPPSPLSSGPERWVSEDWVFRGRTSWPSVSPLPARPRIILYDEAAVLYPLFSRYADEIEFVESHNLPQTLQELQHSPANALVINLAAPGPGASAQRPVKDDLADLVEQARLTLPDTPIIGCALPSPKKRALELGAIDYLIKPVTQATLETALQAVGRPVYRVLIVDDDPDIGQLFTRLLHLKNEALEIITVENGEQALEMMRCHHPDLVLLDIVMPGIDGWQVLAGKQHDETIKDIPVILVSAEDLVTRPVYSPVLLTTMGPGLSPHQLLACVLKFSALLLKSEPMPGLAPG